MGRAIATTEAKAEKAEAKRIAKQLAKAVLDATPEAMAKAEAKAMAKASARAVAAAKLIYEAELHAREVAVAADIERENIVKWPIEENQCLLFCVYNVLGKEGKDIMSFGGTMDVRCLLQSVMSTQGRALIYGVTPVDIHCMLMKVVEEHRVRGRNIGFTWKRVGLRKCTGKGWDVGSMKRTVLNKVGKKFVMLGKTMWANEAHKAKMRQLRNLSEKDICEVWGGMSSAWGLSKVDHAVAVRIEAKEDASRLVDNGCTAGMKLFSMTNLAMRMTDLCSCFEFDLYDL
jgi:hypothetical protein